MPEKSFSEAQYMDDELYRAVLDATGGVEPDSFVESSFGAAVTGPPKPETLAEEEELIRRLDDQLKNEASGIADSEGRLLEDGPDECGSNSA